MTVPDIAAMLAGRPALLHDASRRALAYLDGLAVRRVAPAEESVAALGELDFALPGTGLDPGQVLRMLDEAGSPATVASNGPRYFGFVTGGALPVAQAAAWLIAAWDQNAALTVMSPTAALLNTVALRWVTQILGLPPGTGGGFVTGATMANASCLAAARDAVLTRSGWDAASQGLAGAPPVTVVVGGEVHTRSAKRSDWWGWAVTGPRCCRWMARAGSIRAASRPCVARHWYACKLATSTVEPATRSCR